MKKGSSLSSQSVWFPEVSVWGLKLDVNLAASRQVLAEKLCYLAQSNNCMNLEIILWSCLSSLCTVLMPVVFGHFNLGKLVKFCITPEIACSGYFRDVGKSLSTFLYLSELFSPFISILTELCIHVLIFIFFILLYLP